MPVFGQNQGKKSAVPVINEVVGRVNDNTKRLRLLEQRERLLTSRTSSMEESAFQKIKTLEDSIKELNTKITVQEGNISTFQNTLKEVVKQLKFLATKTDVKKIEETLKILNPLTSSQQNAESQ